MLSFTDILLHNIDLSFDICWTCCSSQGSRKHMRSSSCCWNTFSTWCTTGIHVVIKRWRILLDLQSEYNIYSCFSQSVWDSRARARNGHLVGNFFTTEECCIFLSILQFSMGQWKTLSRQRTNILVTDSILVTDVPLITKDKICNHKAQTNVKHIEGSLNEPQHATEDTPSFSLKCQNWQKVLLRHWNWSNATWESQDCLRWE